MEVAQAVAAIVVIDLTLAGDNALVIGMAAAALPRPQRRAAILLGGAAAVAIRVVATAAVTVLLDVPYLMALGGAILVLVSYRLVRHDARLGVGVRHAMTLREAVTTIVVADAAMSIDNVLGVGGAARGDLALLAFGLALSIPIVLFGSGMIARVLERLPSAVWLGALALVWTAARMILEDPAVNLASLATWLNDIVLTLFLFGLVVVAFGVRRVRAIVSVRRSHTEAA
ncbi:MAG TPA: YjbE family putative metal transport protein [Candidatus Dormibacteraeota bacterium]|nr:YjbE family putative metal transport protein [Candidatus Dormibacteraeota bacterium]